MREQTPGDPGEGDSMTRKDFELIARAIRLTRLEIGHISPEQNYALDLAAINLGDALRGTNPRFDLERFTSACGNDRPTF